MEHAQAYTLAEVIDLGCEARHVAEGTTVHIWTGTFAVRTDLATGVGVRVTNLKTLPDWPWYRSGDSREP